MTSEDSASPEGQQIDAQQIDAQQIDPVISDAVHMVSNRFGVQGLTDLIGLAQDELARAEAALRELSDL